MEKEQVVEMIRKIILEVSDLEAGVEIGPESSFMDDLEMFSVEIFSMVGELEAQNGIRISERELSSIETVGELADSIQKKLEKR